ncbi:MAG: DUF1249 domain-containing protein [Gammaproteobacteria bacterium]|nr:DUF1249 domain-containing protein [Gammaproteobacteria bacterium]
MCYISDMLSDSAIALHRPTQARTFTGLMTLYESNYIRLAWLLPNMRNIPEQQVSEPAGDLPLFLTVRELGRYTTTLHMTYMFRDGTEPVADPDLSVRIYHDARLVETMCCSTFHRHRVLEPLTTAPGKDLQHRWQRNMLLNKWLEYCADIGHLFSVAATGQANRA